MLDKILSFLAQKPERFDVSSQLSKLSSSLCFGIYDPVRSTVRLYIYARSSQNILQSDVLFTIPSKYRPKSNIGMPCICTTSSEYTAAYYAVVKTNGQIVQDLGSTLREIMIMGEYII